MIIIISYLETDFNPVELGCLEELGCLQGAQEILFIQSFGWALVQLVQNVALEHFLVADTNFHWLVGRATLHVPILDQRNIDCTTSTASTHAERLGRKVEGDSTVCCLCEERCFVQERRHSWR